MPKSLAHIHSQLLHLFQNANYPNLGDATGLRGSTAAGNLYLSLHTGLGVPGSWDQTTFEATYANYARVAVVRSSALWEVLISESTVDVSNLAQITWAAAGPTTSQTIYGVGIGTAASGGGQMLYILPVGIPKLIVEGVEPFIAVGGLIIHEPAE